GHSVPLEGPDDAARRSDFTIAPLEALGAGLAVDHKTPVPAPLHLHPLHHHFAAPAPPLRDEIGLGQCPPHLVARRVEDAFDPDLPFRRHGDRDRFRCASHDPFPLLRSRKVPRWLSLLSSISWYMAIHFVSASSR